MRGAAANQFAAGPNQRSISFAIREHTRYAIVGVLCGYTAHRYSLRNLTHTSVLMEARLVPIGKKWARIHSFALTNQLQPAQSLIAEDEAQLHEIDEKG